MNRITWKTMCGVALAIMVGQTIVMWSLGYGLTEATIWGVVCGPGWLATVSLLALALRFFGIEED